MSEGAVTWDASAPAADGVHTGAFHVDLTRMPAAATSLMTRVMHIKAVGDRAAAEALAASYVGASAEAGTAGLPVPHAVIAERWSGGFPQTSFVYEIRE